MIRYFLVLTGILLFLNSASARDKVQSFYAEDKFVIDGDLSEWTGRQLNNFKDRQISIGVRNDDHNLYLLIATRNQQSMRILETQGLTVWLNGKDKTKKKFGLYFIGNSGMDSVIFKQGQLDGRQPPDGMMPPDREGNSVQGRGGDREKLKSQMAGMVIIKSGEDDEDLIDKVPSNGSSGITIKSGMHNDVYLVEMRVPYKSDDPTALVVPEFKKEKLAVGLEWNFNPGENRQKPPQGMGGGRGGGMGGGRGGGMGGGPLGGGGGPLGGGGGRQQMNSDAYKDFWFTVKLADK